MRSNKIRERWERGEAVVSAWLSIGNAYSAEMAGCSGVDCVTVDLQHGMIDMGAMIGMLQAISSTPAIPLVRVPNGDAATLMKALDAGAYGVICPMIGSVSEAEEFVRATRYPPQGVRSYGPARALLYGGTDYAEHADSTLVRLGMIETLSGLAAVQGICEVDGLDGIFIGPSDLGLAMGKGSAIDPKDGEVCRAIDRCLTAARRAKKRGGIFCPSGEVAARRLREGFDFVVINSDANLLKAALSAETRAARAAGVPR
jgi:4-hydroxy-2-oxoheptanedioate aldolase